MVLRAVGAKEIEARRRRMKMNKREACQWVHKQMIVDEMPVDDLVAAFTALVGRVPDGPERQRGLFGRCYEIVTSLTGVSRGLRSTTIMARSRRPVD
jgi:hypothetical protein